MSLSGAQWVQQFPGSNSITGLEPGFRKKVVEFLDALSAAGVTPTISATRRPRQRAYLMHFSWCIWKGWQGTSPDDIPAYVPHAGEQAIDIDWLHRLGNGDPDIPASVSAAYAMVQAYGMTGLQKPPALNSNHIQGKALDMNIVWSGTLAIKTKAGPVRNILSVPRNNTNWELIEVSRDYGVIHFLDVMKDKPHFSWNGH